MVLKTTDSELVLAQLTDVLSLYPRARDGTMRVEMDRRNAQPLPEGRHPQAVLYANGLATVVTYTVYTRSAHSLNFFGTDKLLWTVPFVAAGVARFLWIVHKSPDAESPTSEMLRDPPFILNFVLWTAAVITIIY